MEVAVIHLCFIFLRSSHIVAVFILKYYCVLFVCYTNANSNAAADLSHNYLQLQSE